MWRTHAPLFQAIMTFCCTPSPLPSVRSFFINVKIAISVRFIDSSPLIYLFIFKISVEVVQEVRPVAREALDVLREAAHYLSYERT